MSKPNIKMVSRTLLEVPIEGLRRESDPSKFEFSSTAEVEPLEGTIGQERAVDSIKFGLGIKTKGFNLYASGPPGVGKTSTIQSYVQMKAKQELVPDDWCYVNNFSDQDRPLAISLPPGRAKLFAKDMEELINSARAEIPRAFESKEYEERKARIANDFETQRE
ncbi:MAG TPA: Lon-like protease helical domain-containing protein, partial [Anaerolineae bacterium]|nr:Lon-like protease helical domain-containing protein [Anaerolineae bacterium]